MVKKPAERAKNEPAKFDPDEVERLAGVGMTQEQIADFYGYTDRTLRNHLAADPALLSAYKRGRARAVSRIAEGLYSKALEGDTTSQIFFLKTQAGWRETNRHEHSVSTLDPAKLSDEQLRRIADGEDPHDVVVAGA